MEIIDDEGRLFGVVNVIDALVVLLILAVLIAGIALLTPFMSTEQQQPERYATVDIGEQQPFVAEQISAGDGTAGTTVTDVHVGPAGGANVSVTARVRINGSLSEDEESFMYRGETVRQGGDFTLETAAYTANGTITRLDTEGATLDTATRQVRLDGTLSLTAAKRLQSGDTVTYAGRKGATVETVYLGPGSDPTNRRATATVTVEILRQSGELTFGDQSVQLGQSLALDFGEYGLSGTIEAIGDDAAVSTESATVSLVTTIPGQVATEVQAGETYNIGPETVATIESVTQYPGPSDDQRRLYVDLSLDTIIQNGERYFGPNQLTIGASIPFQTPEYSFTGTIDALGAPAETTTTQVRLQGTVSAATAERIEGGETVTLAGTDIATFDDVYLGPGNSETTRQFVALATLETRRQPGGLTFGTQSIELGQSLTLDFDDYRVAGTIEAIGDDAEIETETSVASIVTTVSQDVASQLQAGDAYNIGPETVATIESVTQYPGPSDDQRRLYVDLSLDTIIQDGEQYFGSNQLTIGASIPFRTSGYSFTGTVETLGEPPETTTTQVALETVVSSTVADAIETGDSFEFAEQSIATVQTMDVYPTGDDGRRRVLLGLDLQTVTGDAGTYFGTDRVTLGSTIPFETDAYRLSGTVIGRGAYAPTGSVTTETISVKVANVEPEIADGIEVGMSEESMGQTTAEIVDMRTEPASIILTSDQGEIFERTHPRNEDVHLTVDVTVRETADGYQFHAQSLKEGDLITLDFRTITVRGTVTDI